VKKKIDVSVNGESHRLRVEPRRTLLHVIRYDLGLTGTKAGCEKGECGSCTVIVNGRPINSCLLFAVEADGSEILTIEGVAKGTELHPLQKSFIQNGAIQCGFCTPGIILVAKALLDENPEPTENEIRHAIAGNFCRCTGYDKIVKAIMAVSEGKTV
jgi:carbon-monoxide dehydrogenase small subunit